MKNRNRACDCRTYPRCRRPRIETRRRPECPPRSCVRRTLLSFRRRKTRFVRRPNAHEPNSYHHGSPERRCGTTDGEDIPNVTRVPVRCLIGAVSPWRRPSPSKVVRGRMAGGDRRRLTARRGKLVAIWRPRDWTGGVERFGRLARARSIAPETPPPPPPAFAQRSARERQACAKVSPSPPPPSTRFSCPQTQPQRLPRHPRQAHVTLRSWEFGRACACVCVSIVVPCVHYLRSTSATAKCRASVSYRAAAAHTVYTRRGCGGVRVERDSRCG